MELKIGKVEYLAINAAKIVKTRTFRIFQFLLAVLLFALQAIKINGFDFLSQLSYLLIVIIYFPIFSAILVLVEDISHALFSFMVLSINFIMKKGFEPGELKLFIPFIVMVVVALIAKPIIFKEKFKSGDLVIGYAAVFCVSLFGGISNIHNIEWYSSSALYVYFAVGMGSLFAYLYSYNFLNRSNTSEAVQIVPHTVLLIGILTFFIVISQEYALYNAYISKLAETNGVGYFQVYNLYTFDYILRNMSIRIYREQELLLLSIISLPVFFYKSTTDEKRGVFYFIFGLLSLAVIILITKISLVIYVSLLTVFLCSILAIIYTVSRRRYVYIALLIIAIIFGLILITVFSNFISFYVEGLRFRPSEETVEVYRDGIQRFLENPFLGGGIGNSLNEEVSSNVKGIMMYKSSMVQILAAFGALGLLAYIFLFAKQIRVIKRRRRKINLFFFISFIAYCLVNLVGNSMFMVLPFIIFDSFKMAFIERTNKVHLSEERLLYYSTSNFQRKD